MQRRRCTYTENSFLASRTLVIHFPLSRALVTAGPGSLFQDQHSFSHWPLLLQNTDSQAPSPGRNHDSGGPKWNPESVLSEMTLAVLLSTQVGGLPGNITAAPLCSPASFHPGPGLITLLGSAEGHSEKAQAPLPTLDAGEPTTARPQRTAPCLLGARAHTKGMGG